MSLLIIKEASTAGKAVSKLKPRKGSGIGRIKKNTGRVNKGGGRSKSATSKKKPSPAKEASASSKTNSAEIQGKETNRSKDASSKTNKPALAALAGGSALGLASGMGSRQGEVSDLSDELVKAQLGLTSKDKELNNSKEEKDGSFSLVDGGIGLAGGMGLAGLLSLILGDDEEEKEEME